MKSNCNSWISHTSSIVFAALLIFVASTIADEEPIAEESIESSQTKPLSENNDDVLKVDGTNNISAPPAPALGDDLETANTFGFGSYGGGGGHGYGHSYRGRHFYGGIKLFGGFGRTHGHHHHHSNHHYNHGYHYKPIVYGHYYIPSHYYGGHYGHGHHGYGHGHGYGHYG